MLSVVRINWPTNFLFYAMGLQTKEYSLGAFSLHPKRFFCTSKNYNFDPIKFFTCLGGWENWNSIYCGQFLLLLSVAPPNNISLFRFLSCASFVQFFCRYSLLCLVVPSFPLFHLKVPVVVVPAFLLWSRSSGPASAPRSSLLQAHSTCGFQFVKVFLVLLHVTG